MEADLPARGSDAFTVALEPGRAYAIDVVQLQTYLDVTWAVGDEQRRTNDRTGRSGREEVFWVAIEPGTYRSLTLGRGLSPAGFEGLVRSFYDKMLLA